MSNTVIAIRSSGVASNTPSLGVLANGEIALNYADGIIYYKTDANTLGQIKTTEPSGLDTEIQFNDSGSFGSNSSLTFDKANGILTTANLAVTGDIIFNGNIQATGNTDNVVTVLGDTETTGYFLPYRGYRFPDGTIQTTAASSLESNTAILTADTANQVIDILDSTIYTSAKYITQAYAYFAVEDLETETSANVDLQTSSAAAEDLQTSIGDKEYEMNEFMVLTNGRDSFIKETSNLRSDITLGTYYTDLDGNNVRLLYSPAYVNTNVSVKRISITA